MKKRLILGATVLIVAFLAANLYGYLRTRNEVAVSELVTGQCLEVLFSLESPRVVEPVLCSSDHVQEVVGTDSEFFADATGYPGTADLEAAVTSVCVPAFDSYTGLSYQTAEFQVTGIYPDVSAWESGDRELVCLAANSDASLIEGSLAAQAA